MKLAIMKLVCLLVMLGGVFMLGLVLDVDYAQQALDHVLAYWPTQGDGSLNLRMPGIIAGILLFLIGLYGFLPKLPSCKTPTITYKGANGDIVLELKPLQKVLLKMMRRMPEVYSINLKVQPDKDGKRAIVNADVVLKNCAALGARHCAKIVAECIASTARDLLGIEDLTTVRVNVKGIRLDAAATSKQIREQMEIRKEQTADTCAVTPPPVAAAAAAESAAVVQTTQPECAAAQPAPVVSAPPVAESAAECEPNSTQKHSETPEQPKEVGSEVAAPDAPVPPAFPYESPCLESAEPLHSIDLPPLAEDDDADLPPAPKINQDGEITTDEAAEADVISATYDSDDATPDAVDVSALSPSSRVNEALPEPVPDESGSEPEAVDVDAEEYRNT